MVFVPNANKCDIITFTIDAHKMLQYNTFMELFSLKGIFTAVASCTLVHIGFATFGLEYLFHDWGDSLREITGLESLHDPHGDHELH